MFNLVTDHPRIRGEHVVAVCLIVLLPGSSPHTRGALPARLDGGLIGGIIPAYAGSTPSPTTPPASREDHPRIRGEHPFRPPTNVEQVGSSPHTRGALAIIFSFGLRMRIIPAYAGSTPAGRV